MSSLSFENNFVSTTPTTVAIVDEMRVGAMIEEGLPLPAEARSAIIVAGISWIEVALMTTSKSIFAVAFPPLSILAIAFIPAGVLAPPIPNIFEARFTEIHFSLSSLSPLKSRLITGRNSRANPLSNPVFSMIFSTDNHTAYMAHNLKHRSIAPPTPSIIEGKTSLGFVKMRMIEDVSTIAVNTKFIQYFTASRVHICFFVDKNRRKGYNISH